MKNAFLSIPKILFRIFEDRDFGEKLIYKAYMGGYMIAKRLNKRGDSSQIWKTLIIIIITLAVGILFFLILNNRVGGLFHLS